MILKDYSKYDIYSPAEKDIHIQILNNQISVVEDLLIRTYSESEIYQIIPGISYFGVDKIKKIICNYGLVILLRMEEILKCPLDDLPLLIDGTDRDFNVCRDMLKLRLYFNK